MNLCDDKELFEQIILQATKKINVSSAIIEKDYFITQLLRSLVHEEPNIIFKGGTSLSKCYKMIDRFSEDIDLNYVNHDVRLTEGTRRRLSSTIKATGANLNLLLENPNEIRSRREFNRYKFRYPSDFSSASLKPVLIVETAVSIKSFPTETLKADSYIYQFLESEKQEETISEYNLSPFYVTVQTKERTFIDKVFAICDYYLTGRISEHSRHLYDLHKLLPYIDINDSFKNLIYDVRLARIKSPVCPSAKDDCQIKKLLREIIDREIYKADYKGITLKLLFDKVSYDTVISSLEAIAALDIWDMPGNTP